ncbi:MAG: hypothetical protein V8Q88_10705 [Christensenellales bacterium]|jgi:hypothetical protein
MKTSDVLPTSTKHQVALSDKKRRVLMGASFGLFGFAATRGRRCETKPQPEIRRVRNVETVFRFEKFDCPFKSDSFLILRQFVGQAFQARSQILDDCKHNRVFLCLGFSVFNHPLRGTQCKHPIHVFHAFTAFLFLSYADF